MIKLYLQRSILKALLLGITIFLLAAKPVQAQISKDSVKVVIQNLSARYQKNALTEKQYLDTVQEKMMLFQSKGLKLSNKEMLDLLTVYRGVIWQDRNNEKFKQAYYALLSNQARLEGRNGEMFYYAEKLNELEQSHQSSSITSLYYIATYYYAHLAYAKTVALYKKNQRFIANIPQLVLKQQLERKELMRGCDMLACFEMAAYKLKDSLLSREIEHVMTELVSSINKQYPGDQEISARLKYSLLMSNHEKNLAYNLSGEAWKNIGQLDDLLNAPGTPEYLKSYIGFMIADKKALFFLETKRNDSAGHYIDLLNRMYSEKLDPMNAYMVKKYEARLLYNQGSFKQSEDTLIKALEILEETKRNSGAEIDEIMYALTKVEEQQFLLADSAKKQKQSDRQLMAFGFGALLLLSGSIFTFGIIRRRQEIRFVDFKLNLARNIHDESTPALLYAKMLARKQRVSYSPEQKDELEAHIELTTELIRSLSHDLQSEQRLTINDLLGDIRATLGKMSILSDFSYSIEDAINKRRFLSHYQFHNLKAILQECVANSVKHAAFTRIAIVFTIEVNVLKITYSDNGNGWPADQKINGIGLQNMQDRMKKLNGNFEIRNHYPGGYQIEMSIKLS